MFFLPLKCLHQSQWNFHDPTQQRLWLMTLLVFLVSFPLHFYLALLLHLTAVTMVVLSLSPLSYPFFSEKR